MTELKYYIRKNCENLVMGEFRIDSKALLKGPEVDVKNIFQILNHTHDEL